MIFLGYFVKVDEGDVEDKEEMEARTYEDREKTLDGFSVLLLTIDLKDHIVYFIINRSNS